MSTPATRLIRSFASVPVVVLFVASACVVGDLDLEGRPCPCAEGWFCDPVRNRCVGALSDGGGPQDARALDAVIEPRDVGFDDRGQADAVGFEVGAPLDLGFTDAEVTDADSPPAESSCGTTHANSLFCDGFDAPGFDGWRTMIEAAPTGDVRLEQQNRRVYRGAGALYARVGPDSYRAAVYATVFNRSPFEDRWLRAYFYLPSARSNDTEYIGLSDEDFEQRIVGATEIDRANFHSHNLTAGDASRVIDTEFPKDRWVCVELRIREDRSGIIELYWDGLLVAGASFDTRARSGLRRINVGFLDRRDDDPFPTRELYVDEVVADESRPGCD